MYDKNKAYYVTLSVKGEIKYGELDVLDEHQYTAYKKRENLEDDFHMVKPFYSNGHISGDLYGKPHKFSVGLGFIHRDEAVVRGVGVASLIELTKPDLLAKRDKAIAIYDTFITNIKESINN